MSHKKRWILFAAVSLGAVILVLGISARAAQLDKIGGQKGPLLCSDLRVAMDVIRDANGLLHLTAKACNDGPGNYADAAHHLDAYYMVITWHPPHTAAQEGDVKLFNHADLGTALNFHTCKNFLNFDYPLPDFSRYGKFPPSTTERQAVKEFTAKLEKKDIGFTKCEDTNFDNTHVSVVIEYMEKVK